MPLSKKAIADLSAAFKAKCKAIKEATISTLQNETAEQQGARVKRLLKPENYLDFFDYYFGREAGLSQMADARGAWFHARAALELRKRPHLTLFDVWARGFAKSVHGNMGYGINLLLSDEIRFMCIIAANANFAIQHLADVRAQLEANERLIKDFGLMKTYGNWTDQAFETTNGGFFTALGVEQPFRGLRNGSHRIEYCTLDDLEDRSLIENKKALRQKAEKLQRDLLPAFSKRSKRLVISNNYCVREGLLDLLLDDKGFTATAKKEGVHHSSTNPNASVIWVNFLDKDGLPAWKERYTCPKDVAAERDNCGSEATWLSEYMNAPVERGRVFKPEHLQNKLTPLFKPHQFRYMIGRWDLSYKTSGDYKAFVLLGVTEDNHLHLLDLFCRQTDIETALTWFYTRVAHWNAKGYVINYFYDAIAAQEEVFAPRFAEYAQKAGSFVLPLPDRSSNIKKETRIEATLSNVFQQGKLLWADYLQKYPDLREAQNQILAFEQGSKYPDDFPDCLEACVRIAQMNTSIFGNANQWTTKQRKRGGW